MLEGGEGGEGWDGHEPHVADHQRCQRPQVRAAHKGIERHGRLGGLARRVQGHVPQRHARQRLQERFGACDLKKRAEKRGADHRIDGMSWSKEIWGMGHGAWSMGHVS
jgi:hypothetical protein